MNKERSVVWPLLSFSVLTRAYPSVIQKNFMRLPYHLTQSLTGFIAPENLLDFLVKHANALVQPNQLLVEFVENLSALKT